jgi:hypothetical protein
MITEKSSINPESLTQFGETRCKRVTYTVESPIKNEFDQDKIIDQLWQVVIV